MEKPEKDYKRLEKTGIICSVVGIIASVVILVISPGSIAGILLLAVNAADLVLLLVLRRFSRKIAGQADSGPTGTVEPVSAEIGERDGKE